MAAEFCCSFIIIFGSVLYSFRWGYPEISSDILRVQLTAESILLFLFITPPPPADIADFRRNTAESNYGAQGLWLLLFLLLLCT